jgi:hypothetical protein
MLNDQVVSATAIANLKAISEQPAMLSNLAFANSVSSTNLGQQNAVTNQRSVSDLGISTLARGTNTVSNLGPMQARSAVDALSNNELAQTIADLKAVVAGFAGAPPVPVSPGRHPDLWRLLKELIKLGLDINSRGELVVPKSISMLIPGHFGSEDLKVELNDTGMRLTVRAA